MSTEQMTRTKVARAELLKRVLIVVTTLLVLLCLVLLLMLIGQVRATQQNGSPAVKAARDAAQAAEATNDQILDCLQPSGECFKESQRRNAEVLGSVQRIIFLSAACSADLDPNASVDARVRIISDCVTERLAATP